MKSKNEMTRWYGDDISCCCRTWTSLPVKTSSRMLVRCCYYLCTLS